MKMNIPSGIIDGNAEFAAIENFEIIGTVSGNIYTSFADIPVYFKDLEEEAIPENDRNIIEKRLIELQIPISRDEILKRWIWCTQGAYDGNPDLNIITGKVTQEVRLHCPFGQCYYGKSFCQRCISPLSIQETQITALIAAGLTDKQIAEQLNLSVYTITTHRRNIQDKLSSKLDRTVNAATIATFANKHGLI